MQKKGETPIANFEYQRPNTQNGVGWSEKTDLETYTNLQHVDAHPFLVPGPQESSDLSSQEESSEGELIDWFCTNSNWSTA